MLIRSLEALEPRPMRPLHLVPALALFGLLLGAAGFASARPSDIVNATCPISGQPVDGAHVVEHGGQKIGVCCAKCQVAVGAWTGEQKDAYLARIVAAGKRAPETKAEKAAAAAPTFSEPYLLTTCPIAGGPVGDTPVAVTLGGRTIQVCCEKCKAAAERDPEGTLARVDQLIADQQRALYPLTTCVVMPEEALFADDGADIAKEIVVGQRLFRACCPGCVKKIQADPAKFAALLDAAALAAQRLDYPLAHCVVNTSYEFTEGAALKEFVIAGRLIRTCCAKCEAKVRAEPLRYVGLVDAARAKSSAAK